MVANPWPAHTHMPCRVCNLQGGKEARLCCPAVTWLRLLAARVGGAGHMLGGDLLLVLCKGGATAMWQGMAFTPLPADEHAHGLSAQLHAYPCTQS